MGKFLQDDDPYEPLRVMFSTADTCLYVRLGHGAADGETPSEEVTRAETVGDIMFDLNNHVFVSFPVEDPKKITFRLRHKTGNTKKEADMDMLFMVRASNIVCCSIACFNYLNV